MTNKEGNTPGPHAGTAADTVAYLAEQRGLALAENAHLRTVNAALVAALRGILMALPQHEEGNCHPETEERTGAACCFYREARRTAEAALLLAEARL